MNTMIKFFVIMLIQLGIFLIVVIFFKQFWSVRKLLTTEKDTLTFRQQLLLSLFFGIYGITGTYGSVLIQGAMVNSRFVGVILGGIIGGPVVGFCAGIIAGGHRYLFSLTPFSSINFPILGYQFPLGLEYLTAIPCSIATIMEGFFGSILYDLLNRKQIRFNAIAAVITGILCELFHMMFIIVYFWFIKQFHTGLDIVKIITMPMIIANAAGISIFVEVLSWISRLSLQTDPDIDDDIKTSSKKFKIFLASSGLLKEERIAINNFIAVENERLHGKDSLLNLVMWEDLLQTFNMERIQKRFNEKMLECDMVIALFFDKVGQFTMEEFEIAHARFKAGRSPRYLYVFFKKDKVDIDEIDLKEIKKVRKLKKKIETMEQIYKTYNTIENLKDQIRNQLNLIPEIRKTSHI